MVSDVDIAQRLIRTRQSAKTRGIEFDLSFKHLKKLLNTKRCYFSKVKLNTTNSESDNYLTLERLDNEEGYIDSNVVACSKTMNARKHNLTPLEIKQLYEGLKKHGIL